MMFRYYINRLRPFAFKTFRHNRYCHFEKKDDSKYIKITVCGATGSVGQPLSLILKQSQLFDELAIYDIVNTSGFGLELSHMDTKCKVKAFTGSNLLNDALRDSSIVIVVANCPATNPRDNFQFNANVVCAIMDEVADSCPNALIGILTNPVNSIVPVANEALLQNDIDASDRIFGITTLNSIRANTFAAETLGIEPESVIVPVIGGNSSETIVPLFSQTKPCNEFKKKDIRKLTSAVRIATDEVTKAKNSHASANLAAAFATARFSMSLARGILEQQNIIECAFIKSRCVPGIDYFASPIELGPNGVQKIFGLPKLSDFEGDLLEKSIPALREDIEQGELFINDDNTEDETDETDETVSKHSS